jgi:N-acetylmuramoyl-L-alanine amidase
MTLYKVGSRGEVVRQIQKALNLYPDGIFGALTEERVKQFQTDNGLKVDGIVGPATLAKLLPKVTANTLRLKKSRRTINEIIIHCTATPEGRDYPVAEIRRWHLARGFSDIGYHYIIHLDGKIEEGRDVNISGAHCTGHNTNSIGVSYIGGVKSDGVTPKDTRTIEQKASLASLLMELRKLYPRAKIHGHRDFANKACPSFDATSEYRKF